MLRTVFCCCAGYHSFELLVQSRVVDYGHTYGHTGATIQTNNGYVTSGVPHSFSGPRPFSRQSSDMPTDVMENVDFTLDSWLLSHGIHGYTGFPWLYGDDDHGVFLPWIWERNRNVWFVGGFPFVCRLAAGAICVGVLSVVGRCLLWRLGQWRKWLKRPLSSSPCPEPVGDKLAGIENFPVNVITGLDH